jgi:hypothetical protein
MDELWLILSSYPTSIYTVLLGVMLVFWLFAIIGSLDIDIISFDADIDIDADVEIPGFVGLMHTLGFLGVPFTIVLSVIIFLAWIFTYVIASYVLPLIPTELLKIVVGTITLLASFILALPITSKIVAPLRKMAEVNQAKSNKDFVGYECKVRSQSVDMEFGQGFIEDGGAGLNVRIRAKSPNEFTKGTMVRIIYYDQDSNSYEVISQHEFENY